MQYQSFNNRPVQQPIPYTGYNVNRQYQVNPAPQMSQTRQYTPPPQPIPYPYAQSASAYQSQQMPSRSGMGAQSPRPSHNVPLPGDYNPKHPPIGFMPELPDGVDDEYSSGTTMSDDTSGSGRSNFRRSDIRNTRTDRTPRPSARNGHLSRIEDPQMDSDGSTEPERLELTRVHHATKPDSKPESRSESKRAQARAEAVESRRAASKAAQTMRQNAEATKRAEAKAEVHIAQSQTAGPPSAMLDGLKLPIECLLLTGEPIESSAVGEYGIRFHEPMIHRGASFVFRPQTKTIEIADDGVYHISYSGRVSAKNRVDQWGRSGLQVVRENGGLMHGIQIEHGEEVPFRASFLGECKAGDRIRLQWQIEALKTPLTLTEPILFIERLK